MKRYSFNIIAIIMFACTARAQLPYDSVEVVFTKIPCYHHYFWTPGVGGIEYQDTQLYSRRIVFPLDSSSLVGDTIFYFKDVSCENLRLIYDSTTEKVLAFLYHQFCWDIDKDGAYIYLAKDIEFHSISLVTTNDSAAGLLKFNEINFPLLIKDDSFTYHAWGHSETRTDNDYAYNGILLDSSSSISVKFYNSQKQKVFYEQKPEKYLSISPNPANERVIVYHHPSVKIENAVFDSFGRRVNVTISRTDDTSFSIDILELKSGIYWLRAGGEMRKFVIAR
jgi:hypothetical protein